MYSDELIRYGTNIKFENGFAKWLIKYNFHNEEEGHYTKGIQPALANALFKKTNNFGKNVKKKIEINIDDIDMNIIIEPNKLDFLL